MENIILSEYNLKMIDFVNRIPEINFNYISKVFPKDNVAMQVLGEGLFADVESMLEKSMTPKNADVKSQKFNRLIPEIVSGDNSFEGPEF